MFFRFPPDARWNPDRSAGEFFIRVGEFEGVVRVPRRVFQILLLEAPTPERCLEAYYLPERGSNSSPSANFGDDGLPMTAMSRSPAATCGNGKAGRITHAPFPIAGPLHESRAVWRYRKPVRCSLRGNSRHRRSALARDDADPFAKRRRGPWLC
jgi:hypothetical protein